MYGKLINFAKKYDIMNKRLICTILLLGFLTWHQANSETQERENPIAVIKQQPGMCGIFLKWGFIGDSLCSGEHEYHKKDGKKGYKDLYQYSWGQKMCRAMGATGDNYSQGGETTRGWIDHFWDNPANRNYDISAQADPKQAYIVALGVNDSNNGRVPVGDVKKDINLKNYHKNADTFAGNYAGIIQRVKSIQPDARFFVVTIPDNLTDERRSPYNEVIRTMPTLFSNVYLLDIDKYGPSYKDPEFRSRYFMGGHLTAMGYQYTAWMFLTYIDHIIRQNPKDFEQVAFIGTPYKY